MYKYTSHQEIFNKVWDHFVVKQNPRSVDNETNICKYYSSSGGCAVGCLIESDAIKKQLDNVMGSVESIERKAPELYYQFVDSGVSLKFLTSLQHAHDQSDLRDWKVSFKAAMEAIALEYKLSIPQ